MQQEFHRRFKAPDALEHRATVDHAVDLVWCQNANGGSLAGRNPSTPRDGKRPLDGSISLRGEKTTWKVTDKCDEEWKEGEHWQKGKSKKQPGKRPKTFQENSQGKDPSIFKG